MLLFRHVVVVVVILLSILTLSLEAYKFTNLKCEEIDPTFARFSKCELKLAKRGVTALNLYIKLLKLPITNMTVLATLYKKANGYKPFLYNVTVNFCDFMKNRKRYPVMNYFSEPLIKSSNANHTCPYNHDVIVKNFIFNELTFEHLPLPDGEYMISGTAIVFNEPKINVKYFIEHFARNKKIINWNKSKNQ